jgi:hypothetical protein
MKALLAGVALAAALPSSAQTIPAARVGALLEASPAEFGAIPSLSAIPVPASAPAAEAPRPAVPSDVPADLYKTLQPPDGETLKWLSSRVPGLDAAAVRVLPLAAADAMFAAAADRGESPLDFFTDPAFRGDEIYYISSADIQTVFGRYEISVLTSPSGIAKDKKPYAMQALVLGGGKTEALYDRDGFDFDNPLFPGHSYKAAGRITQTIQGPGDVTVEGVWVHAGILTPKITRVVKLSATEGRVETNYGSRTRPVTAIRRR